MKINKPIIKYLESKDLLTSILTNDLNNGLYENNPNQKLLLKDSEINSCQFKNIDFTNIKVENIEIYDSIFENCNLANLNLDSNVIHRTNFTNCNLIGVTFIESSLKDITFNNCNLKYNNYSGTRLDKSKSVSISNFLNVIYLKLKYLILV